MHVWYAKALAEYGEYFDVVVLEICFTRNCQLTDAQNHQENAIDHEFPDGCTNKNFAIVILSHFPGCPHACRENKDCIH